MSPKTSAKIINNAVASLEMEGFIISDEHKALCNKFINKEISLTQYIELVKKSIGVDE